MVRWVILVSIRIMILFCNALVLTLSIPFCFEWKGTKYGGGDFGNGQVLSTRSSSYATRTTARNITRQEEMRQVRLRQQEVANERAKQAAKERKQKEQKEKDRKNHLEKDSKNHLVSCSYNPMEPWTGSSRGYGYVHTMKLRSKFASVMRTRLSFSSWWWCRQLTVLLLLVHPSIDHRDVTVIGAFEEDDPNPEVRAVLLACLGIGNLSVWIESLL